MSAEANALTPGEYIRHHLQHLQVPQKQNGIVDFSVINLDSIIFSVALGALVCFMLYRAASKAHAGVPGRFQAAVEMLFELVDTQAKAVIHNAESRKLIGPMALTVFVWIFMMNFMDMLPLDLLPQIWAGIYSAQGHDPHHAYLRIVPSADLSTTLGLSCSVLLMCLFYNIKIKGIGGWIHELTTAPFGSHPVLWPVNFAFQLIEFVAKTVSHGMRLFGNMFAGELVFMLIALLGAYAAASLGGGLFFIGHIIAGTIWTLFHILVITLQAFIFMMLTLIYLGQAHDAH